MRERRTRRALLIEASPILAWILSGSNPTEDPQIKSAYETARADAAAGKKLTLEQQQILTANTAQD